MTLPAETPRGVPPNAAERLLIISEGEAGGSLRGTTRFGRRLHTDRDTSPVPVTGVVVVEHGDDPTLARPLAVWVIWVGLATPDNAADYDGWYVGNVTA